MGLRAVLATGLSALLIFPLATAFGVPAAAAYPGVMLAMSAAVALNEPERAARVTMALLPVAGAVALLLGTLLAPHDRIRVAVLGVVVFFAVWARRFGPRGFALGMVAFMAYFVGVFFAVPLRLLPEMGAGVVLAFAVNAFVQVALVPNDPTAVVAHARRSLRALLGLILREMPKLLDGEEIPRRLSEQLRRSALQFDEQLDAAENQDAADLWRDAVVEEELAIEAGIQAVRALRPQANEVRRAVSAALHAARTAVRRPSAGHEQRFERLLNILRREAPEPARAPLHDLCVALHEIARQRDVPDPSELRMTGTGVLPLQKLPPPEPGRLRPTTRLAIQAAIATTLAALAGHLLSSQRWYWAVIASFVVFNSAATAGDALVRAWNRTLGTAAGIGAGFAAVEAAHRHRRVEVGFLFVCIFLGFYAFRRSYFWLVVCITALIAVFYSLVGRFTPGILFLRLEETVIGAAIAVLVASFILTQPTVERAQRAVEEELRAARGVLEGLSLPAKELRARARAHDRALLDVVLAADLLQAPVVARTQRGPALPLHQVVLLGHRTRLLARQALRGEGSFEDDARRLSAELPAQVSDDFRSNG
jgi:uncharacterized membrane protein YccC